ncbi:unnamed protein product [Lasius platythorax]|uniref:Uncharacterized protein n=1 Tax=Lasius platythorax TaxID=488582 RepID=A0AAV2NXT0_9HYME
MEAVLWSCMTLTRDNPDQKSRDNLPSIYQAFEEFIPCIQYLLSPFERAHWQTGFAIRILAYSPERR